MTNDAYLIDTVVGLGAERCEIIRDPDCGLEAVIVIDDTTLGPAAGGIRTMHYPSLMDAAMDAQRLARAMTLKCALSGLRAGGGKGVVVDHPGLRRDPAFKALGTAVEALEGLFRTAGDIGTGTPELEAMATRTRYVHVNVADLSVSVAHGLACVMEEVTGLIDGLNWPHVRLAVQGCGAIGSALIHRLSPVVDAILVTDIDAHAVDKVVGLKGVEFIKPSEFVTADADILAPCAVGGVLNSAHAKQIHAQLVCGGANNILCGPEVEDALIRQGIRFVPDIISSAGAVVDGIGMTVMGLEDRQPLLNALGHIARTIMKEAIENEGLATELAEAYARMRIQTFANS